MIQEAIYSSLPSDDLMIPTLVSLAMTRSRDEWQVGCVC
jgi:hypothetical protein